MWAAIRGNHAEEMHVLVQDHDLSGRLNPLLSIRRQNLPRQAVRQTTRCGIVFDRITGGRSIHEGIAARLERTHLCRVVCRNARRICIAGTDEMSKPRTRPYASEIRSPLGRSRNGLSVQERRHQSEDRKYVETTKTQRHGAEGDMGAAPKVPWGLPPCPPPRHVFVSLWFLHTYSRGATSSAEPAKTFRPSANVTLPPEPLLEPSLARKPSTLITSPTFKTSFVIPLLANMPGGPPENPHVVTFPLSSLTST